MNKGKKYPSIPGKKFQFMLPLIYLLDMSMFSHVLCSLVVENDCLFCCILLSVAASLLSSKQNMP